MCHLLEEAFYEFVIFTLNLCQCYFQKDPLIFVSFLQVENAFSGSIMNTNLNLETISYNQIKVMKYVLLVGMAGLVI